MCHNYKIITADVRFVHQTMYCLEFCVNYSGTYNVVHFYRWTKKFNKIIGIQPNIAEEAKLDQD